MSAANNKPAGVSARPYRFPQLQSEHLKVGDYASAQEQLDAGYAAGHEQGYSEGFDEGKQEGFQTGKKEGQDQGLLQGRQQGEKIGRQQYEQVLPVLNQLSERLQLVLKQQIADQKDLLIQLVRQVTERVFPTELVLNPKQIQCLVDECCAALPDPKQALKIYLNPMDKKRLLAVGYQNPEGWPLLEDPALQPGDCRIESSHSASEASLSRQLNQSIAQLAESLEKANDE